MKVPTKLCFIIKIDVSVDLYFKLEILLLLENLEI